MIDKSQCMIERDLHAAGGVDKHHVSVLLTSVLDSGLGNLTSEDELRMKLE
jgi:hypothetical protein